jgi:two-component system, OmpR family, sensor histidine kinase BaeS
LRTLSLADAGELSYAPQMVAIPTLLSDVAARYRYRAQQQGITLEEQVQADLPLLQADPMRMTQVLANILDNAFRHTPQGGKILIAASSQRGGVGLSVSDNGPGVDPGDLERIFDRFYRADPSRQREGGSGLGLAIAKSIVEMHAGEISAGSAPGQGLTISIWLPLEKS